MADPLILVNSYRLQPGKEDAYQEGFRKTTELVEAEEPKMLYFAHHLSEDGTTATTVQVHADADNLLYHMELVAEHIQQAAEHIEWSSMSLDVYGTPSPTLLEQMRQVAGSGVAVTVNPPVVSFSRLPVPQKS